MCRSLSRRCHVNVHVCTCAKNIFCEGSGTELYPNAGHGILISAGEPLVLSGC